MNIRQNTDVPDEIRAELSDSLTERGIGQWWNARNRLLQGFRPCDCWDYEPNRKRVMGAAKAFSEGTYV